MDREEWLDFVADCLKCVFMALACILIAGLVGIGFVLGCALAQWAFGIGSASARIGGGG